ncbi:MAG: hypothetical protein R3E31_15600 [Chloroflexota bacterium]|nr:hypothetical protein [Anaerolineales bacterium]MCB8966115.1 hypothetical protein [Ardenticatenaceae bacterium]
MTHKRFTAFDNDTKIQGALLSGWKGTMYEEEINTLLAKYGLDTVDAEGWYPIRPVLEFLTEVETHYDMFDLIGIGKHIGANFVIPDPYQDMVTYLMATDQFYAVPYQGEVPGSITPEQINGRHVRLTLCTPWPHDYWYGTFYGLTNQLAHPDDNLHIERTIIDEITCVLDIVW